MSSIPCCVCKSYSSTALCWLIYDVHVISPQARLRCSIYRVIYFLQNCSPNHSLIQSSNMWNWNKEVSLKIFFCHVTPFHYQANGALAVSGYLIRSTRGLSTFRKIIYSIFICFWTHLNREIRCKEFNATPRHNINDLKMTFVPNLFNFAIVSKEW